MSILLLSSFIATSMWSYVRGAQGACEPFLRPSGSGTTRSLCAMKTNFIKSSESE